MIDEPRKKTGKLNVMSIWHICANVIQFIRWRSMNGGTNMYGTIYKITNTINGKVYIGQTKQPFHYRYPKGISSTTN